MQWSRVVTLLKTKREVDRVARGRVWSGKMAMGKGLVDEMGGINQAIDKAVELAGLDGYELVIYPERKTPIEEFLGRINDFSIYLMTTWFLPDSIKSFFKEKKTAFQDQIQTRLPFAVEID